MSAWRFTSQAQRAEEVAARVPLENYLKGHATDDGDYIRKAFHPEAKVFSFRDDKLNQLTLAAFAARFTGKPAPDEAQRKRWIESVKITGNAGICRYLLQMITPTAKTQMNWQAARTKSTTSGAYGATNRALGESSTPYHSAIEEPTQQFETERRAK